MFLIKFLRGGTNLLRSFSRIVSGFFRLIFKGIFYKILVKIYFNVFRLKKNDLALRTINEVIRNQLVYIFIFTLTIIFIFGNLSRQTQAVPLTQQISQTVMANLTSSEFSNLSTEILIEDTTGSTSLNSLPEKYSDTVGTLTKNSYLSPEINIQSNDYEVFSYDQDLMLKPQLLPGEKNNADNTPTHRTTITKYTVQNGDTVSRIAKQFGLTINTILWANNLTAYSLIRPGDILTILPYSGIQYTVKSGDTISAIANKYDIDGDKILSANNLSGGLMAGATIILPGAQKITTIAVRSSSAASGLSVISSLIKQPAVASSGNNMLWPTVGHRITQYFSWRHTGLDIANKIGTPLYAADDGVVTIAQGGWNGGYGNTIVINHGGGIKTRYGHASKLFVKVGDVVKKGDNIAAMGSTGRSTGPHLHFEIIVNNVRVNPLNYIR
ncbi:M23 family metallopeptidase [Candidatus Falkowbacteria bacterium]|nr:M23 family metallopeptidase [Candidatus Falkowbacteria bacterium]NCQ13097.1 M23 family metallopeptidase [Candidatus Falkowbacteria bacterium]